MSASEKEIRAIVRAMRRLTPERLSLIKKYVHALDCKVWSERAEDSDVVTAGVSSALGDRLVIHHAGSREALSKDRFEYAFEASLNASGISAKLVRSRTNRGHDIDIRGIPTSLKTAAASGIRDDIIHVSKWMELGKGEWDLPKLRDLFLGHLTKYERIFTFRKLSNKDSKIRYELVEIPKDLLLEATNCELIVCENSRQNPKPGYGYVRDEFGKLKFALYFDGGTERKLQLRDLRKDLCKVHATWSWDSASTQ